MLAFAPSQARLVSPPRADPVQTKFGRVRCRALGLFFLLTVSLAIEACTRLDPHALALRLDEDGKTGLYTWLVDHDPSAIVTDIDPHIVRRLAPDARFIAESGADPCAEAIRRHALWLRVGTKRSDTGKRSYDAALDCGVAIFRDAGGLAIAPR